MENESNKFKLAYRDQIYLNRFMTNTVDCYFIYFTPKAVHSYFPKVNETNVQ